MKDTRSISLTNLETGEIHSTNMKFSDDKFMRKGAKMYVDSLKGLVDLLTKDEFKTLLDLFSTDNVDYCNVLIKPFKDVTSNMHTSNRSKFKKKLIENGVLFEYQNKLMINPFLFIPRGDRNIKNCNWLTQKVWTYLVEDCSAKVDNIEEHIEHIFGKQSKSDWLKLNNGMFIKAP